RCAHPSVHSATFIPIHPPPCRPGRRADPGRRRADPGCRRADSPAVPAAAALVPPVTPPRPIPPPSAASRQRRRRFHERGVLPHLSGRTPHSLISGPDAGPAAAPVRGGPRVLPERVFQR